MRPAFFKFAITFIFCCLRCGGLRGLRCSGGLLLDLRTKIIEKERVGEERREKEEKRKRREEGNRERRCGGREGRRWK